MERRSRTWQRVAATLIVAIAVATVWATVILWVGYFVMQFTQSAYVTESINVSREGTPFIESRSSANWMDVSYRTLDGRPIDFDPERALPPAGFPSPAEPPGVYEPEIPWSNR